MAADGMGEILALSVCNNLLARNRPDRNSVMYEPDVSPVDGLEVVQEVWPEIPTDGCHALPFCYRGFQIALSMKIFEEAPRGALYFNSHESRSHLASVNTIRTSREPKLTVCFSVTAISS